MKPVHEIPMAPKMVQAFLRQVTGRIDVSEVEIARTSEGLVVLDPEEGSMLIEPEEK